MNDDIIFDDACCIKNKCTHYISNELYCYGNGLQEVPACRLIDNFCPHSWYLKFLIQVNDQPLIKHIIIRKVFEKCPYWNKTKLLYKLNNI